jgi:hypothetical protein
MTGPFKSASQTVTMRLKSRYFVALIVVAMVVALSIQQALAAEGSTFGPSADARAKGPLQGVAGTSVTRVKMQSGSPPALNSPAGPKTTAWVGVTGASLATQSGKNQLIRLRFSAPTHCRAMTAQAVGQACSIRFLIDGVPSSVRSFGEANFIGSQSTETYVVYLNAPAKTHQLAVQARTSSTDVWFYLQPWVATFERVDNVTKD